MFTTPLTQPRPDRIYLCAMALAPKPNTPLALQSVLAHALGVVRLAAAELVRLSRPKLPHADHASHRILADGLAPLGIPVVSEEGGRTPHAERQTWSRMWLVDPLDGTGSFIRMHSGYAINVALIESDGHDWHPILGIVALPDLDRGYFGGCGIGTWKARIDDAARPPRPISADEDVTPPYSLLISWNEPGTLNDLVAGTVDPTQVLMRPASGAAKFCLVAEGKADLHARSTGYFEWDGAAGDALFRSQGLAVCDIVTGRPLTYNGPTLRVGGLIASRIPTG